MPELANLNLKSINKFKSLIDFSSFKKIMRHFIFPKICFRIKKTTQPKSIIYKTPQAGVTLIELVITIVVLGIALAGLVSALSVGIGRSAQPMWEGKALELTQAYLDEILAMAFDDQTPSGGGEVSAALTPCSYSNEGQGRELFDDVDDYNGVSDNPPVLIDSTIDMSRYTNYQVDILVVCAGTDLGLDSDDMAKRITITISVPSGEARSVAIYKGNY